MPDIKNYDKNDIENDLKRADAEKSGGVSVQLNSINIPKPRKGEDDFKTRQTARKRLPLAVDIIVAILFVALFAGVVVGAYFTFRYFANDYENASVEYVIAVDGNTVSVDSSLEQKNLYFDVEESLEYFGKVKSVKTSETDGKIFITVSSEVRYKENDGYSIGDVRLAVGEDYILRSENGITVVGTVVELTDAQRPLRAQAAHSSEELALNKEGE